MDYVRSLRDVVEAHIGTNATSALAVNVAISVLVFVGTLRLVPSLADMFLAAGQFGHDINKPHRPKIPEMLGSVCGVMWLVALSVFIPVPFVDHFNVERSSFPLEKLATLLSALLSVCCMILLGFADDVIDLRWRHKLLLPTIATIPLLMVYYVTYDKTDVVIPIPLRFFFGQTVDLGVLYYIFMGLLAVFCTNSINILAGINGVEAGQALVIAISIAVNNYIQLSFFDFSAEENLFSLYLILPFIATTSALLYHNWYPSRVFVGDTFCYFAGMTFAVVGILGHFSKTMLLFFIPQTFNFLLSVPQLFHWVECPRHRLPRLNKETGLLEPSRASLASSTTLGRLFVWLFSWLGLIKVYYTKPGSTDYADAEVSNFTIINMLLVWFGPKREDTLASMVLAVQILMSVVAFVIRYPLASIVYN